MHELMLTN